MTPGFGQSRGGGLPLAFWVDRDCCEQPVSRILSRTAIPLGVPLLTRSSNLPGGFRRIPRSCEQRCGAPVGAPGRHAQQLVGAWLLFPPYLVLLRVGFTLPSASPWRRCALTAPFHPYPQRLAPLLAVSSLWHWPSRSLDAAIPDVIRHTALWSSDFPLPDALARARQRPPSCSHLPFYLLTNCVRCALPMPLPALLPDPSSGRCSPRESSRRTGCRPAVHSGSASGWRARSGTRR